MLRKSSWSVLLVAALACLPALVTCSDDDTNGTSGSGGKGGGSSGTTGGSGAAGGTANAGSGGSAGGTGGTATSGGSAGSGGSSGSAASGGSGASGGGSGSGGAAVSDAGPPPPTEAGLSVYSVECSGDSRVCGYPDAKCVSISLGDGSVGFMCSNICASNADCSTAPSGAEAQARCVPFTAEKRCVLLCNDAGTLYDCPSGMICYTYPGSPSGYCLWM